MQLDPFNLLGWRWDTLVSAMLHSLWEGPIVALLLSVLLRSLSSRRAQSRYVLCFAAQMCVLITSIATASAIAHVRNGRHMQMQEISVPGESVAPSQTTEIVHVYGPVAIHRPWTTWVGWLWTCGVGIGLFRTTVQTIRAGQLANSGQLLTDPELLKLNSLARIV
jgi:hypothetical protein